MNYASKPTREIESAVRIVGKTIASLIAQTD